MHKTDVFSLKPKEYKKSLGLERQDSIMAPKEYDLYGIQFVSWAINMAGVSTSFEKKEFNLAANMENK